MKNKVINELKHTQERRLEESILNMLLLNNHSTLGILFGELEKHIRVNKVLLANYSPMWRDRYVEFKITK